METKKVIAFKNKNFGKSRFNNFKWSTSMPIFNRLAFLKEKGIDTTRLMYLSPCERASEANKIIKQIFTSDLEAVEVTITALEKIRNATMRGLFDYCNSFSEEGDVILKGGYNQKLFVKIEFKEIVITSDMVMWEDERECIFVEEIFENKLVVYHSITPSQNLCYLLAVGCKIEDGLLKVGKSAKFYFSGAALIKEVDFKYWITFNKNNRGESIIVPSDMDILKFNFHHYKWKELLANGDYAKKDVVSVAKTDNGNYVVFQDNPRRALVILTTGEVIENNIASFGNARSFQTNYYSLDYYRETIEEYNEIIAKEKAKKEAEYQERISEMYKENKGWYIVELRCFQNNHFKGGHKERWTNWKILANSQMDAYNKAVTCAEEKGYFWFAEATKCQIDFYGVWTDEKEDMLRVEGLI